VGTLSAPYRKFDYELALPCSRRAPFPQAGAGRVPHLSPDTVVRPPSSAPRVQPKMVKRPNGGEARVDSIPAPLGRCVGGLRVSRRRGMWVRRSLSKEHAKRDEKPANRFAAPRTNSLASEGKAKREFSKI